MAVKADPLTEGCQGVVRDNGQGKHKGKWGERYKHNREIVTRCGGFVASRDRYTPVTPQVFN
jgi:hypothetical protein